MKIAGFIYLTTNLVNGKIYIGQHIVKSTKDFNDGYIGSGTLFQRALRKYGKKNFKRRILKICYSENQLNAFETYYIKKYNPNLDKSIGYNQCLGPIDVCGKLNPAKLPEVREKIKNSRIGKIPWNKGRKWDEETKRKISEAQKGEKSWTYGKRGKDCHNYGRKLSEETKRKLSEKLSGKNNPNYGRKWGEDFRRKISEHHADVSGENNPMYGKRGEKSPMYGRKWINNGEVCKFIDISNGIPKGFKIGRL